MKKYGQFFTYINSAPAYTAGEQTIDGTGVYSADEWHESRKVNDNLFSHPSDRNFRQSFYKESKKIISVSKLCEKFDFSNYKKLGDIGGAPFYQALVISDFYPNLEMLLTDYDYGSCELLKSVSYFSSIELQPFDAKKDDYNIFNGCDLLTSWGVDYALSDEDILKLFNYIKVENKTLLIASFDVDTNIIRFVTKSLIKSAMNLMIKKRLINRRVHGVLRNAKYFSELSKIAEVAIETIQIDSPILYRIYKVTP